MFNFLSGIFAKDNTALKEALAAGAMLVDVRSAEEFRQGSVKGAVNIPLDRLSGQLQKFKGKKGVIVFCASGMRSSEAKRILDAKGVENMINGGSWINVKGAVEA